MHKTIKINESLQQSIRMGRTHIFSIRRPKEKKSLKPLDVAKKKFFGPTPLLYNRPVLLVRPNKPCWKSLLCQIASVSWFAKHKIKICLNFQPWTGKISFCMFQARWKSQEGHSVQHNSKLQQHSDTSVGILSVRNQASMRHNATLQEQLQERTGQCSNHGKRRAAGKVSQGLLWMSVFLYIELTKKTWFQHENSPWDDNLLRAFDTSLPGCAAYFSALLSVAIVKWNHKRIKVRDSQQGFCTHVSLTTADCRPLVVN